MRKDNLMLVKLPVKRKDKRVEAPLTRKCHVYLMLMILSYVNLAIIIVICKHYYCKKYWCVFMPHESM